jgi:hypothetical protein
MLVGERDHEAVESIGLQLFAERRETICIAGHGFPLRSALAANKLGPAVGCGKKVVVFYYFYFVTLAGRYRQFENPFVISPTHCLEQA